VSAAVRSDANGTTVRFSGILNPTINDVQFEGCRYVGKEVLRNVVTPLKGGTINREKMEVMFEAVIRAYRSRGFSLARIDTAHFDEATGI